MTSDQLLLLTIGLVTIGMFLWGRWRHDVVGAGALLACVVAGLVPARDAFAGFGHPAVVTVACVLVLSRTLQISGVVGALIRALLPARAGVTSSMAALLGLGAALSSLMNNVGAMALLMPAATQLARRLGLAPGKLLMPLAFSTILGGMTTLIGTPPNVIVSGFRAESGAAGFGMFDFAPVGVAVALAGVAFVVLLGWRLVPVRKQGGIEGFESGAYITEARVLEKSKAAGMRLCEVEAALDESGAQVIGMVHHDVRLTAPGPRRRVDVGDILVIEAEAGVLADALSRLGLELEEAVRPQAADEAPEDRRVDGEAPGAPPAGDGEDEAAGSDAIALMELVVLPGSPLAGRSASDILLRTRYGLNLLALSRRGQFSLKRLRTARLASGDLLLMQGAPDVISEFAADNDCVPLAQRELRIPDRRKAWEAGSIAALAVGSAAFGLLPMPICFAIGVLALMVLRTIPLRAVYSAVDWPVIVLLGTLIPVADAMESTGSAGLIARFVIEPFARGNALLGLGLILVLSMFLSDLMNNAATAAVMCPIAIGTATALGADSDAFLMAVAIGASCAFLTPIGHQNNTLILGPGGFRFGDYWKLGVPLEVLVVVISMLLLPLVWPL